MTSPLFGSNRPNGSEHSLSFSEERSRSPFFHSLSIHSFIQTHTTLTHPVQCKVTLLQPSASLICLQRAPPMAVAPAAPTSVPNPNPNPSTPASSNRRPSLRNPLRMLSKRFAAATTQFQRASLQQPPRPSQPQQPPHPHQPHPPATHGAAPYQTHPRPQIPTFSSASPQVPLAAGHHHVPPPPHSQPTAPFPPATSVMHRMPADVRHAAPVVSSSAAASYSNYNTHWVIGSHL